MNLEESKVSFSTQEIQPITISMDLFQSGQPVQVEAHGDSGEEFGDDFWSFNICSPDDLNAPVYGTLRVVAVSRPEFVEAVRQWFAESCQRLGLSIVGFQDLGAWYEDERRPSILMGFLVIKNS